MNSQQPDLCVGIDFGTTYTGVSWNAPGETAHTAVIDRWPGEAGPVSKVPTVLAKDASGREARWGGLCEGLAEDRKWKLFKLLLDPEEHKRQSTSDGHGPWVPPTTDQLHEIVTLYLNQIYIHISNEIPALIKADPSFSQQLKLKTWDSLKIDFVFSTPATWNAPISHCFKDIVSKAGFGEHKLHKATLGLTEPEAAALSTCQPGIVGQVRKDDVILSIDAGGGTTDIAFVKATDNTNSCLALDEIHPVSGVGVGSTRIDSEFAKLIQDRIKNHPEARLELPRYFALKASQSVGFLLYKHKLGPDVGQKADDTFAIRVKELQESYSNQSLGIQRGKLIFTRQELESCFNVTLEEIKGLIHDALHNFGANNHSNKRVRHVDYVVLSGGLGSSDYVLEKLTAHFKDLANEANSCVAGSKVLGVTGDARMVVAQGLLYDRRPRTRALRKRIARASYGIIVEEPQSSASALRKIIKQYPSKDVPAPDRIRWLVKSGETIQVDKPITLSLTKRLEKSDQRKWTEKIIWLMGDSSTLPENVEDALAEGAKELLNVDIEVREGTKLRPSPRIRLGNPPYDKCDFELRLVIGPSGDCDIEVSDNVIKRSK